MPARVATRAASRSRSSRTSAAARRTAASVESSPSPDDEEGSSPVSPSARPRGGAVAGARRAATEAATAIPRPARTSGGSPTARGARCAGAERRINSCPALSKHREQQQSDEEQKPDGRCRRLIRRRGDRWVRARTNRIQSEGDRATRSDDDDGSLGFIGASEPGVNNPSSSVDATAPGGSTGGFDGNDRGGKNTLPATLVVSG